MWNFPVNTNKYRFTKWLFPLPNTVTGLLFFPSPLQLVSSKQVFLDGAWPAICAPNFEQRSVQVDISYWHLQCDIICWFIYICMYVCMYVCIDIHSSQSINSLVSRSRWDYSKPINTVQLTKNHTGQHGEALVDHTALPRYRRRKLNDRVCNHAQTI